MTTVTERPQAQTTAPVTPTPDPVLTDPAVQVTDKQLSPQFAALARQAKINRKVQAELKAREDAIKAKEAEFATGYIPKSRLKSDFLSVLSEEGIDNDSIVKAQLSQDPQMKAVTELEKRIMKFEEGQKKAAEESAAQQTKAYEQALNGIRTEVKLLVDSNADFEAIKAQGAEEAVVALIEETYKTDGIVMKTEDAAKQVEEFLLEEAIKLAKLEKVQKRLAPPPAETPVAAAQKPLQKTLTNQTTVNPSKPLTDRQRRERAIAAFKGQLAT